MSVERDKEEAIVKEEVYFNTPVEPEIPIKKVVYQEENKPNFLGQKDEISSTLDMTPEIAAIRNFTGSSYLQNSLKGVAENEFTLGELKKDENDTKLTQKNPLDEEANGHDETVPENDIHNLKNKSSEQEIKEELSDYSDDGENIFADKNDSQYIWENIADGSLLKQDMKVEENSKNISERQDCDLFRCEFCQKVVFDEQSLVVHRRVHTGEKPFSCELCGKNYASNKSLNNHLKTHEDGYQVTKQQHLCNICGKHFSKAIGLKEHEYTHTGEKPYECFECGSKFSRSNTLKNHMMKSHMMESSPARTNSEVFRCEFCQKVLRDKKRLLVHRRVHTGEKPYSCELCGKCYPSQDSLKSHLKTHEAGYKVPERHRCKICHRAFGQASRLKDHEFTHTGETPYECDECGLKLSCVEKLHRHKRVDHEGVRHQCQECGKQFTEKSHLNKHVETQHRQGTKYPCKICGKIFAKAIRLKEHEYTHTGEKPYECLECGLKFSLSHTWKTHMMQHSTSSEVFRCEFCQKVLRDKNKLLVHRRVHTGEKPFSCELCAKRYPSQDSLKTHLKIHEAGYKVPKRHRGKAFSQGGSRMKDHEFTHTGAGIMHQCPECGKQFTDESHLNKHVETQHHSGLEVDRKVQKEENINQLKVEEELPVKIEPLDIEPDELSCSYGRVKQNDDNNTEPAGEEAIADENIYDDSHSKDNHATAGDRETAGDTGLLTCLVCRASLSNFNALYYHMNYVHSGVERADIIRNIGTELGTEREGVKTEYKE